MRGQIWTRDAGLRQEPALQERVRDMCPGCSFSNFYYKEHALHKSNASKSAEPCAAVQG